jgi:hypothetical protein
LIETVAIRRRITGRPRQRAERVEADRTYTTLIDLLSQVRRVATHYEEVAANFLVMVHTAAIRL